MTTRVRKWGNSLAVRIPKAFASEAGLKSDSPVEISLDDGRILLSPARPRVPRLKELLKRINKTNLHGEFETGPAVGKEIW